jgi:hypothetical protein
MANQSKRAASSASSGTDDDGTAPGAAVTEMARRQLAAGADALGAMFRAAESLQQAQLQMGQRAALLHSQAADNLRKATTPAELVTIQSTLMLYEMQEGMRFWQEFMAAAAKAGSEIMRPPERATATAASAADGSAAAGMMGAAMNAAAPMADAFQQMFTAPMKAAQQSHH